jgi:hypothetical protein
MTSSQVCYVYDRPLIRLAQGQPARETVYVHSTVYLATHSSPLCVRFHTREAVSCGGCRSSHTEVPTRVRFLCGSLSVNNSSVAFSSVLVVVVVRPCQWCKPHRKSPSSLVFIRSRRPSFALFVVIIWVGVGANKTLPCPPHETVNFTY